jgi:hypothetical protein
MNNISLEDISIRTELRPGDIGYVIFCMERFTAGNIITGFNLNPM